MGRDAPRAEDSGASVSVLLKAETLAEGEQECPPGLRPVDIRKSGNLGSSLKSLFSSLCDLGRDTCAPWASVSPLRCYLMSSPELGSLSPEPHSPRWAGACPVPLGGVGETSPEA